MILSSYAECHSPDSHFSAIIVCPIGFKSENTRCLVVDLTRNSSLKKYDLRLLLRTVYGTERGEGRFWVAIGDLEESDVH